VSRSASLDADVYALTSPAEKPPISLHTGAILNLASSLSKDGKNLLITQPKKLATERRAPEHRFEKSQLDHRHQMGKLAQVISLPTATFHYTINADGRTDVFLGDLAPQNQESFPSPQVSTVRPPIQTLFSSGDRRFFLTKAPFSLAICGVRPGFPQFFATYVFRHRQPDFRRLARFAIIKL